MSTFSSQLLLKIIEYQISNRLDKLFKFLQFYISFKLLSINFFELDLLATNIKFVDTKYSKELTTNKHSRVEKKLSTTI